LKARRTRKGTKKTGSFPFAPFVFFAFFVLKSERPKASFTQKPKLELQKARRLTACPAPPILPQPMSAELSKTYEPSAVESEAYRVWLEEGCFHAEPGNSGDPYAIVIPPPNVTAALHLGHALNNTVQDILTRYHRMRGDNTCWLPGTDHAGIATQTVLDKRLQDENQPALKDY
jgi:hypothetical protein